MSLSDHSHIRIALTLTRLPCALCYKRKTCYQAHKQDKYPSASFVCTLQVHFLLSPFPIVAVAVWITVFARFGRCFHHSILTIEYRVARHLSPSGTPRLDTLRRGGITPTGSRNHFLWHHRRGSVWSFLPYSGCLVRENIIFTVLWNGRQQEIVSS